jgi:hypothetical protein
MAYPNIPSGYGLIRHHFITSGGDGHAYILYGVHLVGGPTAIGVATDAHGLFTSDIVPGLSNFVGVTDTMATINNGGVLSQADTGPEVDGGVAHASVPVQVCALIRKQTGVIGRHFRGRVYLPGMSSDQLSSTNESQWSGAAVPAFQTRCDTWLGHIQGGAFFDNMVLLHRDIAVPPTTVTSLLFETQIATQRRRNRKAAHR